MTWLVFDCPSGMSGDMTLGALVDLGVPIEVLEKALGTLPLQGWKLRVEATTRNSIAATRVHVELPHEHTHAHSHEHEHSHAHGHEHSHPHSHEHDHSHEHSDAHDHPHRNLPDVLAILRGGQLSPRALAWSERVFEALARAEAAVHRQPVEAVHFHEVGAVDAIVDIAGACVGLDWLCTQHEVDDLRVAQIRVGRGQVKTDHGMMPVPAPATLRLLEGLPISWSQTDGERVTPTGAAILAALVRPLGDRPVSIRSTGYGAGAKDFKDAPNVLRIAIADPGATVGALAGEGLHSEVPAGVAPRDVTLPAHVRRGRVSVLETTLDDMVPEHFGHLMSRLFEAGALDVQYVAVQAKKDRPATRVTVVAKPGDAEALARILFDETTTLGIRVSEEERYELERRFADVATPYGPIRVKIARRPDGREHAVPEYDSVRAAADAARVPIDTVYRAALRAADEARS